MRLLPVLLIAGLSVASLSAQSGNGNGLIQQARGAKKVVVGTVTNVTSTFDVNAYGDRLIVSNAQLHVDETLKGPKEPAVTFTVEGGTVGELSLSVSDMPVMEVGERAVVFLDDTNRGGHVPHGRGYGVLKLNANNQVDGTTPHPRRHQERGASRQSLRRGESHEEHPNNRCSHRRRAGPLGARASCVCHLRPVGDALGELLCEPGQPRRLRVGRHVGAADGHERVEHAVGDGISFWLRRTRE
jgi:hypothetical protein